MDQELNVQLLPHTLAQTLENNELLTCSHRSLDKDLTTPWKDVQPISEEEGMFVYLRNVRVGHRIQLRVVGPQEKVAWQSPARLPWPMVQLKENQNG